MVSMPTKTTFGSSASFRTLRQKTLTQMLSVIPKDNTGSVCTAGKPKLGRYTCNYGGRSSQSSDTSTPTSAFQYMYQHFYHVTIQEPNNFFRLQNVVVNENESVGGFIQFFFRWDGPRLKSGILLKTRITNKISSCSD